ncbi:MAG: hypothetical protein KC900_11675 [Candidatus Omnitrophica bacterium]|nr:hypothetical protein [Candidatus Omnitrophota bacterium]
MKRILMTAFLVLFATKAGAQLLMEESRVQLTVTPGETVVDGMNIHNTGQQDVDIRVYWQDFEYVPPYTGKKNFTPPGTSKYSMGEWVTYSPQVLTVPAQGKREIRYTIKVPEDATGGHYGVLFFERSLSASPQNTGVNIITRLGSLFYLETVDSDKSAVVDEVRVQDEFIRGRFANEGDVFLFPRGVYYLVDNDGVPADRGEIDTMYVMPDTAAEFSVVLDGALAVGDYTMVITFDLGGGESVTKEIDLTKFNTGQYQIRQVRD